MTDGRSGPKSPEHRRAISEGMKRANQRRKEQRVQQPTTTDDTPKISEYLAREIDSHSVYPLASVADDLVKGYGMKLMGFSGEAVDLETPDGRILRLYGITVKELARSEGTSKIGPKGFTPNPGVDPKMLGVSGYVLSSQIARQLIGFQSKKMGRGSSFRDEVAALREAGL